jgi:Flp pilus assembly protein CpaB
MRVVTVPVSDKTLPDKALLYPGCFVDVLTTWKLNRSRIPEVIPDFIVDVLIKCKLIRNNRGAISITMLRRIQVLSIKRDVRGTFVNLLVEPRQAEALQLAVKNGSISLSLRNPLDIERNPLDDYMKSRDRIIHSGSKLEPTVQQDLDLLLEQPPDNNNQQ